MDGADAVAPQKAHRASRTKKKKGSTGTGGKKEAVAKPGAFARRIRLAADRSEKRIANPTAPVDRSQGDTAPRIVTVVGPSGVGKSTIIRNLVKHYSKRNVPTITGPVTLVAGRRKRLSFVEVGADLASMIDAAKVADLVLLVIDASFGFEMETFEFLNIAAAQGMPKIIAVLTHLDKLREGRQCRRAKKTFKDRIWAELYDGAKVFYLSGLTTNGDYLSREILNLARFISVAKFPLLRWRADHPYILADRVEDITPKSLPPHANRTVAAYGYVRGSPLRPAAGEWRIHLAGVADLVAKQIEPLPDPCPPPEVVSANGPPNPPGQKKKRKVSERERMLHAPMAPEVDGIAYERDAVYINLNEENIRFSDKSTLVRDGQPDENDADDGEQSSEGEGEKMVKSLQKVDAAPVDHSLKSAQLQLVTGGKRLISEEFVEPRRRRRRRAVFDKNGEVAEAGGDSSDDGNANRDETKDSDESDDSGSDDSESDDESEDDSDVEKKRSAKKKSSKGRVVKTDAPRQKTASKNANESDESDESSSDEEAEPDRDDREDDGDESSSSASESDEESGNDSAEDEANDDGSEHAAQRWKEQMIDNSQKKMKMKVSASKALVRYIYEKNSIGEYQGANKETKAQPSASASDGSSDEDDTFFRPRRRRVINTDVAELVSIPDFALDDITRLLPTAVRAWVSNEAICERLRKKRWGTGLKSGDGDGEGAVDDDENAPLDGDFEDLETGEVHEGEKGEGGNKKSNGKEKAETDMATIHAEKVRQKEKFDADWDDNGGKRSKRGDGEAEDGASKGERGEPDVRSRKALRGVEEREPDFRKLERERAELVKQEELGHMDAESRLALEGMLPGQYVRLELQDVPVEFVKYFDPNNPIVLGGLRQGDDEGKTMLRGRVRRHRFKRGVLKSNDPVVFSIGWRRFQAMPVYDMEDQGGRRRFLKYTPEFLHCNASFWGPSVGPGAGIVMCQTLGRERGGFRIGATGVVTEVNMSANIVKKLKLVGEAVKVHRNTAFIKGMFNSELEASKYVGAAIRTVSGIRGTIKKAFSEAAQRGSIDRDVARAPTGTFRAGFEDRILLSDIVFLRAWVGVEVTKFCSVASTLLDDERNRNGSNTWRMRTVREVRESKGMAIPLIKDSLYGEIERGAPIFAPMRVPKAIEGALPYATKPKDFAPVRKEAKKGISERKADISRERVVVLDKKEKEERSLLSAVYHIRKDRITKRKQSYNARLKEKKKVWKRENAKHAESSKLRQKRKHAMDGAKEARLTKKGRHGGGDD